MAVSSTVLKTSATSSLASSNSTNQSLLIWAELRKDILAQVWSANRDIIRSMTAVIMRVQDVQWRNRKLETLKPAIEEYRRVVHASLDLLSPKAVDLCQRFLMTAYEIFEAKRLPEDGNPLKAIRYEFTIESWSRSILHMSKGNQLLLNWPLETGSDCMDFNLPLAFLCKNP